MPTYEYRCPDGHIFERRAKMSEAASELACPECGKIATRQLSGGAGLVFKGSGFYLTDYGKNAHRGTAPETAAAAARRNGDAAGGESSGGDKSEKAERAGDAKSAEAKPAESKSAESKSGDRKTSDAKSSESKSSEKSAGASPASTSASKKSDQ
jgi:putative FmdB family regulatory protein